MVNMVALVVGIFSYVTVMPVSTNGLCRTVYYNYSSKCTGDFL